MFSNNTDRYFNERCQKLARKRDALVEKYNCQINQEYENEKSIINYFQKLLYIVGDLGNRHSFLKLKIN